jgi:hypothetical protein
MRPDVNGFSQFAADVAVVQPFDQLAAERGVLNGCWPSGFRVGRGNKNVADGSSASPACCCR